MRFCVVYYTFGTDKQKGPPEWCSTWDEAVRRAASYNRSNQDRTWNAVNAYPVDVNNQHKHF